MAEVLLSPGVLATETDNTFLTNQPVQAGAAILGPTVKGPVGIPTIVTSYSDYKGKFGAVVESGSDEYTYFTSVAAYNYFQQGGNTLLVTRIVSGSYSEATSSVDNSVVAAAGDTASADYAYDVNGPLGPIQAAQIDFGNNLSPIFVSSSANNFLPGINLAYYAGGIAGLQLSINTNYGTIVSASLPAPGTNLILHAVNPGEEPNGTWAVKAGSQYACLNGTAATKATFGGGTNSVNAIAFELETLSEGEAQNSSGSEGAQGELANGTRENIRWEVVSPNTSSGTFGLIIRRGDDTTTQKSVLETWPNLSLDPNSSNYIARVIGDQKQVKRRL